ncbi:hypothetical protein ACQ1PR_04095, partial [Ornithobacterium rhinotracheale]
QNNGFSPISNVNFASAVSLQNGGASIGIKGGENKSISLQAGSKTTLSYTLTGTPEEGVLMANFNHLGLTADLQTQVGLGSASVANKDNYTVSLYYQPTNTVVPGKINNGAEKVTIKIPYTNGKGSYNAVNINNIRTAPGQNGDVNDLSLSIPAGNFGVKGELTATIKVEGDGEYLVKQMAPGEQYTIATFPIDMNGTRYDVVLKGIGGIPDRCFGKTTLECVGYGANVKEHEFIYVPIEGPDGRTWLNNNLGAEYARVGSPYFNPMKQAESSNDWKAYGSLFQWQRKPDGHELYIWNSGENQPMPKYERKHYYESRDFNSWDANTNEFIGGSDAFPNWNRLNEPRDLWTQGKNNNPCPNGYHVPSDAEFTNLKRKIMGEELNIENTRNKSLAFNSVLKFPGDKGYFSQNGSWHRYPFQGTTYWTSDYRIRNKIDNNLPGVDYTSGPASAFTLRCIKDN